MSLDRNVVRKVRAKLPANYAAARQASVASETEFMDGEPLWEKRFPTGQWVTVRAFAPEDLPHPPEWVFVRAECVSDAHSAWAIKWDVAPDGSAIVRAWGSDVRDLVDLLKEFKGAKLGWGLHWRVLEPQEINLFLQLDFADRGMDGVRMTMGLTGFHTPDGRPLSDAALEVFDVLLPESLALTPSECASNAAAAVS